MRWLRMLKQAIKAAIPRSALHEWRKFRFNPRLKTMGVTPKPVRQPLEYLGTDYGGHVVDPATVTKVSVVYALGAGMDISFEEELIARTGCHVHVYDPTPRSVAWMEDRFKAPGITNAASDKISIHPLGIWSDDKKLRFYAPKNPEHVSYSLTNLQSTDEFIEVECVSLGTAMKRNGHDHIDLLKLNVEGAEYAILNAAFNEGLMPKMLLVNWDEIHTEGDAAAPERLREIADRIASLGYRAVFAELARVTYIRGA